MTARLPLLLAALALAACGSDDSVTTDGINDTNAPMITNPAVDMDDAPNELPAGGLDEALGDPASPESGLADYGESVLPDVDRPVTTDRQADGAPDDLGADGLDANAQGLDGTDGLE